MDKKPFHIFSLIVWVSSFAPKKKIKKNKKNKENKEKKKKKKRKKRKVMVGMNNTS